MSAAKKSAQHNLIQQRGVGLIEIMITLAILTTGLTALIKLQTQLIKNNLYTQQRAEALVLVQRKLEDLHAFSTIAAPIEAPEWNANLTTAMAYNYIDTDKGGKMAAGEFSEEGLSAVYFLHWHVVDHVSGLALTTDTVNTSTVRRVTITVSWQTTNANTETVIVTDVIAAINPDNSVSGLKKSPSNSFYPNPAKKLKPELPNIAGRQTSTPVIGDALTKRETAWQEYKEEGGHYTVSAIGCACTQSATTDTARVVSFRDGAGFDLGAWVVKRVGISNDNDAHCKICCKNHHDVTYASATPSTRYSFSAFRVQAGYRGSAVNKDHSHYFPSGGEYSNATHSSSYTPAITYSLADAAGNIYNEACFLELTHDGFVTVTEDLTNIDLTIFPEAYLQSAEQIALYSDYVKTVIEQTLLAIDSAAISSGTRLYASPSVVNNTAVKTVRVAMNIPDNIATAASTPLKARVVALPYMKPWMIAILRCKINGSELAYSSGSAISDDEGVVINCKNFPVDKQWLKYVPFHEVDVTDYVEWLVSNADNTTGADVVSAGVTARGNPMGLVTLGTGISASAQVSARIRKSNSAYLGPDYFVNAYDDLDRLVSNNAITVTKSAP